MRNKAAGAKKMAQKFRKEMSPAELVLWSRIRRNQLGVPVRRQYPVGPYFLDFYIPTLALCIEVDGRTHEDTYDHDSARDAYLVEQGVMVVRIWASEIGKDLDSVVNGLLSQIEAIKGK